MPRHLSRSGVDKNLIRREAAPRRQNTATSLTAISPVRPRLLASARPNGDEIAATAVVIRLANTNALSEGARNYINSSNISLLWTAALFGFR